MSGKSVSPEKIAEAVTLRAAGYTVTAIADRLGVSVRTLHRMFDHHKAKKGEATNELIQTAKRNLMESVSNEHIKVQAALMVADDLAHVRLLRSRMADSIEHLQANNLQEVALLARACAAFSVAIKNTSDTLRRSLGTEKALEAAEAEDLPVLLLSEVSPQDALRTTLESFAHMTDNGRGQQH